MNDIVWLASYPKSGNTWLRVVLANIGRPAPISINELDWTTSSAHRKLFDGVVGYAASDLTHDEVDLIRPDLYRYVAATATRRLFFKTHDALTRLPDGQLLFPPDATAGAIYVVRNPLDVCASFANHVGVSDYDAIVADMANPHMTLSGPFDRPGHQLRQRLLRWSDNVLSWTATNAMPVHVVRYEDMHAAPIETFAAAAAFAGIAADRTAVERAVAFSSIDELQRQERAHGFFEGLSTARSFFRKGKVGSWREELSDVQVARIIGDHGEVMRRFGYLTDAGEPVY